MGGYVVMIAAAVVLVVAGLALGWVVVQLADIARVLR